jgi:hypothetical protein
MSYDDVITLISAVFTAGATVIHSSTDAKIGDRHSSPSGAFRESGRVDEDPSASLPERRTGGAIRQDKD